MKKRDITRYSIIYICFAILIIGIMRISGKSFVHFGDGYTQYYPIYLYIGEWIRNFFSTGSLRWFDFSIGYGENIIGVLNYYGLGDPINFLSCLVQGEAAYYMFVFGIFLRIYLAGLGMLLYLHHKRLCGNVAVSSSFIYAFSGYSLGVGLWFYPFLSALYLFPYLVLVLERIIETDRINDRILFSVLIGIQACCGFYFLYMQVFLLVIFAIIHYLEVYRDKLVLINIMKKIGELCIFGVFGILLAGFFLFPSLDAFFCSSRAVGDNDSFRLLFSFSEMVGMLREMVIPNTDAEKNSLGIPVIGLFAVCLALGRKYQKTEIRWTTIAFVILYFCPFAWSALNGMSYESNRWTYGIYFVLAYIVCKTFVEIGSEANKYLIPFVVTAGSSVILHYLEYGAKIRSFVYLLLILGIVVLLMKKMDSPEIWAWVIVSCVGINVLFMFSSWRISGFNLPENFVGYEKIRQMKANSQEYQGEWFRENKKKESYEVMLNQKHGVAEYLSMLNGNVFDFYSEMYLSTGIHGGRHNLRGPDERKNIMALLQIMQYVDGDEVVENPIFKKQGLLYRQGISTEDFMKLSPVERQLAMMQYVVLDNSSLSTSLQIPKEKEISFEVLSQHNAHNKNQVEYIEAGESVELKLHSERKHEGVYVLISQLLCYQNDFEVLNINGEQLFIINPESKYNTGTYDYLIYIPADNCENVEITFQSAGNYSWENIRIYEADESYMAEAIEGLSKHSADIYLDNDTYLLTKIESEYSGYYFYSIPYSKSWKAYLDGSEIEIQKANIGFMAVGIPSGEHVIELKYCPIWIYIGGVCTILTTGILCLLGIIGKKCKS